MRSTVDLVNSASLENIVSLDLFGVVCLCLRRNIRRLDTPSIFKVSSLESRVECASDFLAVVLLFEYCICVVLSFLPALCVIHLWTQGDGNVWERTPDSMEGESSTSFTASLGKTFLYVGIPPNGTFPFASFMMSVVSIS